MFDVAEIGSTLAKEEYKARMPDIALSSWRRSSS